MPPQNDEKEDVQQQAVANLKRTLEGAAGEVARLQSSLTSQQQLEQLLKQGRVLLQELRNRLQQVTGERDRLERELAEQKSARHAEVDTFTRQVDDLREQLQAVTAERNRLIREVDEREAARKQYADERADERATFERLLAEATSNQREMAEELSEQRQQIETLREAAMRAQTLAREIMRAHDSAQPLKNPTT